MREDIEIIPKVNSAPMEIVSGDSLQQITKAEIDCAVATAHRFPRSMDLFKKRAFEMATMDEETAASCLYRRPVGEGKFAEGLSIRTAEIVGASYGNLRVGAMLIEQTDRQVKARGYAHDLETNFASTSEVIESTVDKHGKPYSERMRVVVAKAALAKARRDATFMVVPKAICKFLEVAAKKIIAGDSKTFETRRKGLSEWISSLKIDPKRVFSAVGVQGLEDIGVDQITLITGLKTALSDGDITLDEAFPSNYMPVEKKEDAPKPSEGFRSSSAYQKLTQGFKNGGWREIEVHWGTKTMPIKGLTLGELEKDNIGVLNWLIGKWEPIMKDGKFSPTDLALRSALDAAAVDIEDLKSNGVQQDAPQS